MNKTELYVNTLRNWAKDAAPAPTMIVPNAIADHLEKLQRENDRLRSLSKLTHVAL